MQLDGTFMITTATVPVFALRPTSELADTVRDGVILGMDRVLETIRQMSILEAD